ncbi:MAG: hypothetical protein V3U80_04640 [Flavobacteriaceae bacterium]
MLKNKNITRFGENFIWLFLWNNVAYLFSFLTLPILIAKYGSTNIGIVFTVQVLVLALAAIANYSFTYFIPTQSKRITNNEDFRFNLWNTVVTIRLFFSVLLSLVSIFIVIIFFNQYLYLWLLSLFILLPKIINPILFCNALEENSIVFKIGFFTKLIFLILIYFTDKIYLINLFFGLSEFIVLLFFLSKMSLLNIRLISLKKIIDVLKQTYLLFLVSFFSLLKPASIIPAISYLLGTQYATYYTLADKIMNVIRGVSGSMFISFFPIYNKENIQLNFFSRTIIILSGLAIFVIWTLSPFLIYYLNDFTYNNIATKTLQRLALSIPSFFIVIPLISYLLDLKKWNVLLFFAALQLIVLAILIFTFHQNIIQMAQNFVISEYVLVVGYYFYIIKYKEK